jgi:hypothetical protein
MCLALVFLSSFFYVQKHKHDNFTKLINQEIELKKGVKYNFKYVHPNYDEAIDYSSEIRCLHKYGGQQIYKYNFVMLLRLYRDGRLIKNVVTPHNAFMRGDWLNNLGFSLISPYKVLPGDHGEYEVFLEVLSSDINLPKYKSVFRVTINDVGQWGHIRTRMVWHKLFMWLSGIILLIYFIVIVIKFKKQFKETNLDRLRLFGKGEKK